MKLLQLLRIPVFGAVVVCWAACAPQEEIVTSVVEEEDQLSEAEIILTPPQKEGANGRLEFRFAQPRNVVLFPNAQNDYRSQSWTVMTEGVELVRHADMDVLVMEPARETATIEFKPWTNVLPRDYTPALAFADNSFAYHVRQFEMLDPGSLEMAMSLEPDLSNFSGEDIPFSMTFDTEMSVVVKGQPQPGPVTVSFADDPGYVFVGQSQIIERDRYAAMLDPHLPEWVSASFETDFERTLDFMEQKFGGGMKAPISVLYSFEGTEFKGFSLGGSTLQGPTLTMALGGQQFMALTEDEVRADVETVLAHETAHLFQKRLRSRRVQDVWIHEGHANAVANDFMQRESLLTLKEIARCRTALSESATLAEALDLKPYECGAVVWAFIDRNIEGADLYAFWDELVVSAAGARMHTEDVLALLEVKAEADTDRIALAGLFGDADADAAALVLLPQDETSDSASQPNLQNN